MPTIPDVPAFAAVEDSGNMAFLAAQVALSVLKISRSVARLAGDSGDVFKCCYDNAPVYAPLRDMRPVDTLARAFAAVGLRAEWVPDATLNHVRGQVEAHAEIGQPILASGLPGEPPGTFVLLAGYDEDSDTLSYRRASADPAGGANQPYATRSLADEPAWHGPITGAPHWVDFPMLVVRGPLYNPPDELNVRRTALETALAVLDGDPIPYPAHPGAAEHADVPLADRRARQGLAALALLADDLSTADLADAALRWRIAAFLRQLAWDRELAVHYFEAWDTRPTALMARYRTIAHTARTLLSRFQERRSVQITTLATLRDLVDSTAALLYALPQSARLQTEVQSAGLGQIIEAPDGLWLAVDSPARRESTVRLAQRLAELEAGCRPLIEDTLAGLRV
ncbi:MAG: hypothetical protein Kow0077_11570 [Anaerolineae bacterium]